MSGGATQGIQVTVEKDLSTVVIGSAKVEIGADGKRVTAYASDGVEIKSASGEPVAKGTQFSVSEDFNTVVLNGVTIEQAADGHLVISAPGTVVTKPSPANDTAKAALQIGDPAPAGDSAHAGLTYAGILPGDDKPSWVQFAPKLMDHYAAAAWAKKQGGSVPTRKQGDYLGTIKDIGALKTLFNHSGSFPAGAVWLAEPLTYYSYDAWCQRLSDGYQLSYFRDYVLPALCLRR